MNVQELIAELQKLPAETDILIDVDGDFFSLKRIEETDPKGAVIFWIEE